MGNRKLTRNKNPAKVPGDIRVDPLDMIAWEQPLDSRGKALRDRAYGLFDIFREQLTPEHEEMRSARAMRQLMQDERSKTSPPTMTLNSCVDNVLADQIDNMPEAVLVPEREETSRGAEEMTDVVGFVLYQSGWPGKYQKIMEDAVVAGTGIAQTFWDEDMMDGEGMVNVIPWHPEDFYPDPMYENIQDGRGCFKATLTTVGWINEHYPDVVGYVHPDDIRPDDPNMIGIQAPDGDEKVTLLEFWYKRYDAEKRRYRVHMAQLAGKALLYSTELGIGCSEEDYEEGVYAHGQYPFLLFKYRDVWRKPFGTGLIHDYRDTQNMIDRCLKYIDDNARESSIQRHFIRRGSGINADDIADYNTRIIEWDGSDIREVMQTIQAAPLNNQVYQIMQYMGDAMKQDSGQNQFSRGEGGMGVTAASAINQLISQGGKITRWHCEQFKDAFREMVEQILWILSEYMDGKRVLRIAGGWESGMSQEGRKIVVRAPNAEGDVLKKPAYSVRVQVQKHNPVWSERFNELVMRSAEISAQTGRPIPAKVLISTLQGFPDKGRIVRMLTDVDNMYDQIEQQQAEIEQLKSQIEAKDAVIASDAKALGTPSLARGNNEIDYQGLLMEQADQQEGAV